MRFQSENSIESIDHQASVSAPKASPSLPKWLDNSKNSWCPSYSQDFYFLQQQRTPITRLDLLHVWPWRWCSSVHKLYILWITEMVINKFCLIVYWCLWWIVFIKFCSQQQNVFQVKGVESFWLQLYIRIYIWITFPWLYKDQMIIENWKFVEIWALNSLSNIHLHYEIAK